MIESFLLFELIITSFLINHQPPSFIFFNYLKHILFVLVTTKSSKLFYPECPGFFKWQLYVFLLLVFINTIPTPNKMEILQEKILKFIREKYSSHWELEEYKDHIIINLPDTGKDYRSAYQQVKKEITRSVQQHFSERNTELIFEVRSGSWNFSFRLAKTLIPDR
jgi:energy-coupling factor transporter transmembrane protein EcfT